MSKRNIWLKGSEIREMTNQQLSKYEFNVRYSNPDEPSDHELLKQLSENQASDHKLLMQLAENQANDHKILMQLVKTIDVIIKEIKDIKIRLDKHDEMFREHGWMK